MTEAQNPAPILSIRNLTIALPRTADRRFAVEGLSFEVHPHEIVCIVGESGSGKSITSYVTMGLLPKALKPSAGEIVFEGKDLLRAGEQHMASLRGNRIGMIFQEPMTALNPCYTIGNQIEEVFQAHSDLDPKARKARVMALLEEVKLPDPAQIYGSYPHQLSGGQRQRIVIAMALAMDPKLLIADEPTTALDVTTQAQILAMFRELKTTHGAGIIFVTHDFDVVAEVADKVVVMQNGRVVEQGPAEQVLNRPQHPYTKHLIAAVPRRTKDGDPAPAAPPALQVTGLQKTFVTRGRFLAPPRIVHAVKDVSFSIPRGQTLGIVGESGSGKSTLAKCLVRLLDSDGGQMLVDGVDLASLSQRELRPHRKDIQIIFQDPYGSLNPRRTVASQLIEGPVNFGMSRVAALARARELLRIVRLSEDALNRYPAQFSGGQRQRICIARALMMEPKILIADEAVSALDVSVQKEVLKLLSDIKCEMGLTMIFITHDLRVAAQVSDEIVVMSKGEIVERGNVAQVLGAPADPYTRQLIAAMPGSGWEVPEGLEA